jgi:S1-C subfamily serine protease
MKLTLLALLLAGCTTFKIDPVQTVKAAEFKITCGEGSGSGILLEGGKILTASHVVGSGTSCTASTEGRVSYPLKVGKNSPEVDLATLEFIGEKPPVKGIPLAKQNPPQYTFVYIMGHPLGFDTQVLTSGAYQGDLDKLEVPGIALVTAPITFGNSGGPVIAIENGHPVLIGIVDAIPASQNSPTYHLGLVVNLETIKEFLK